MSLVIGKLERKFVDSDRSDVVNSYVIPIFEGLGKSLCFLIGIEVLVRVTCDFFIAANFEVGNCVHLIDVKYTVG
tara:strand:+ start:388 stop:612 length:225 start_codon:yes stop_codon:yes gene_type:complete